MFFKDTIFKGTSLILIWFNGNIDSCKLYRENSISDIGELIMLNGEDQPKWKLYSIVLWPLVGENYDIKVVSVKVSKDSFE